MTEPFVPGLTYLPDYLDAAHQDRLLSASRGRRVSLTFRKVLLT